jgi:hypothetical protein
MPLFEIIYIPAHQSPKGEIDSSRVLEARDAVDAADIYKRRLKGIKKRKLLSVMPIKKGNAPVRDCLHTGEKTDIEGCLNTRTTASGACKECGLGVETGRGS